MKPKTAKQWNSEAGVMDNAILPKGLKVEAIDPRKANQAIYDMGKQEGRKEAVEWIKEHGHEIKIPMIPFEITEIATLEWQARLKEWGL